MSKITIAIPTFNREKEIKRQISFLLTIIDEDFTILVIDNASDVPVSSIFDESVINLSKKKLSIYRNDVNIGGYANVLRCFERCETEYLWIIGDDNSIKEDFIHSIKKSVDNFPQHDLLHFGYPINTPQSGRELDNYISAITNYSHFISLPNTIYKTSAARKFIGLGYRYAYSGSPQSVISLAIADTDSLFVFLPTELINKNPVESSERWSFIDVALGAPILCEIPLVWDIKTKINFMHKIQKGYSLEALTQQFNLMAIQNQPEALYLFDVSTNRLFTYKSFSLYIRIFLYRFLVKFPRLGYNVIRLVFNFLIKYSPNKIHARSDIFEEITLPDRRKRM